MQATEWILIDIFEKCREIEGIHKNVDKHFNVLQNYVLIIKVMFNFL